MAQTVIPFMLPKITKLKKIIYLGHAATTPVDGRVLAAMKPFWSEKFGNPSSLYQLGREAKEAVTIARQGIAKLIHAKPSEIIFTAGGSESVSLAIFGVARNHRQILNSPAHLITSKIEHHCVINSFKALAGEGYKTSFVDVSHEGLINIEQLKKAVRPETILISVMLANNEIGTIQPIAEIGKWLRGLNKERLARGYSKIVFHTDACQGAGFLDLNVEKLGVDLMSVNGSKIYGPKQTGFLYVRSGINIAPLVYGGGQERGLRSGTENVAGIAGLAKAFELAYNDREKENKRLIALRDYLIKKISDGISASLLNGPDDSALKARTKSHRENNPSTRLIRRLPNNINFSFPGVEGESLMLYLDSYGFAVSTGSACSTGSLDEPSHVLTAIGRSKAQAESSIRFSLGKANTKSDLDKLIKILPQLVKELKKVSKIDN